MAFKLGYMVTSDRTTGISAFGGHNRNNKDARGLSVSNVGL